ncbi:MAG: polymerase III, gamma/tau subunit protein [Candidatus Daviesbacteria bacterium GW2011_GWA1_41_61]|uniref:Polymerase III, gamma/tau subunit protein n=1 Tax=Candidatus Daviesbacteria bacterium GW2011_GWA2_40_9 TaxID=1618424 RepID=A0A0G0U460_9BACT|nr:MAG: ATPase [Candidatus Daviesbacteria bacterium GW2011_GWC1_40_9]KKR83859.1 MAG: polymerase III, gamma/tau subunit protein [Candidatus Daviesbacteria bacterium GW2011_GWA2_40_9]KKR93468.1 MAG: polymerase III, gamma/tau subunit protein [Candidatus Daviesbacteria bacterium GW2011_GWB1_41_15]KKS14983.1 MAG: polymerase III, gamma/tau subunit protein [Candidatus Daviesbacteria bacterium GW2011_GWA1_41_61]
MVPHLLIHPEVLKRRFAAEKVLESKGLSRNHLNLLWFDEEDKLGIEQVRQIKEFLSLKPYHGGSQAVVLIAAENLTLDAQNALLKTLEEPPGEALIILGVSSEDQLLPTILSRCQTFFLESSEDQQKTLTEKDVKSIEKLLESSVEERFVFIEKLKERGEFLKTLTTYFRNQLLDHPSGVNTSPPSRWTHQQLHSYLKELIQAQRWAKQNVNIRAVLEYLILKLPQLKQ